MGPASLRWDGCQEADRGKRLDTCFILQVVAMFVLIPGAGSDPEVYGATIDELRRLGHDALAPPLPLDDPDAHPSDHAAAVASATPARGDVVVVAQSLGAFAGPLAAEQVGAALLVLLAPMVPAPGETAGEWWENTGHAVAVADLLERQGPMSEWGEDAFDEVFLHDVDPDVARAAERFNGAPGRGMFTEPWPHRSWPDVPTRVLCPRDDRLFPLDFQARVVGDRLGLDVDEMAGGHLPMLSRPAELARRLVELWTEHSAETAIRLASGLASPPGLRPLGEDGLTSTIGVPSRASRLRDSLQGLRNTRLEGEPGLGRALVALLGRRRDVG